MEARLKVEPTAAMLAMMCSSTLQKGDLNLQKKKQCSKSLSIIPSSLQKEKKSGKQTEHVKWLSAH